MDTLYNNLASNSYRFEVEGDQARLRLYKDGERKEAYVVVDVMAGYDAYAFFNMPYEDRFSLRHWFKKAKRMEEEKNLQ